MGVPTRSEIIGHRPHWLLDLVVGGRVFRLADEDLDVTTSAGVVHRYHRADALAGLTVTLGDGPVSVAIEIDGTNTDGDPWALVIARGGGGALVGASATLRRWFDGQTIERARTILSGDLTEPEYGAADEPFTFTIERVGDENVNTIPPADARIDETTWPVQSSSTANPAQGDATARGLYYPWVFGTPGIGVGGFIFGQFLLNAAATPARIGSSYGAMVVGGVIDNGIPYSCWIVAGTEVVASTVTIEDLSADYGRFPSPSESFALTTMDDGRGRTVTVALVGADADYVSLILGNEYWATWSAGGIYNETRTGPLQGAGEIVQYMLREVGERVDAGRMSAIRTFLDRFQLDFALWEPVKPRQWITDMLGAWLPIVWRESEDGIYLDVYRYDATAADAVLHLVESESVEADTESGNVVVVREGAIKSGDARQVENDITIRYGPARGSEMQMRRRLAAPGIAGQDGVADPNVSGDFPTGRLGVSQARHRHRAVVLDCPIVCRDTTADLLLAYRARWKGIARRRLSVTDESFQLDMLEPASVVTYSGAAVYLQDAVALIRSVTLGIESDRAEIELLDNPESP